jgi:putative ABC transport system permease protein
MVEEQRTQIGTMKALGYDKFAISAKYLGYALIATFGGSILGVLVGEKVIPLVITYAYCNTVYQDITNYIAPYNMYYAVLAAAAALVCTIAATLFSCYKELMSQPAVLMRPPAPKKGKRVLLERITFIWKRLSFIWKSTVRNLFRYKKRFFMTVFGIGGCMALLLVGFGIKDSIGEISKAQFTRIQIYDGMAYLYDDASQEEWEVYLSVPENVKIFEEFVILADRMTQEKCKLTDDGVVVNEKTAKMLGVQVGDTIKIKDTDKGDHEVVIADICENYTGHYIYMTKSLYEKLYSEEYEANCIYFTAAKSDEAYIEETGKGILSQDAVLNVSYLFHQAEDLHNMLSTLDLVVFALIISAALLAFVNWLMHFKLKKIDMVESLKSVE